MLKERNLLGCIWNQSAVFILQMVDVTKIVSLNVNGLNQYQKRGQIFRYIKGKDPDLTFLQETYSSVAIEKLWSNEWGKKIYFSHGSSSSKGVACLVSHKFKG